MHYSILVCTVCEIYRRKQNFGTCLFIKYHYTHTLRILSSAPIYGFFVRALVVVFSVPCVTFPSLSNVLEILSRHKPI